MAEPDGVVDLDFDYLLKLVPESWPVLRKIASDPTNFPTFAWEAEDALIEICRQERAHTQDWRSWQWRRSTLRADLEMPIESPVAAR